MSIPADKILVRATDPSGFTIDVDKMYVDLQGRKKMVRNNRLWIWTTIVGIIVWSATATEFSITHLFTGAANIASFLVQDLLWPDFSAFSIFIKPALDTIYMSYVGMIISVCFSLFFGVLAAKNTTFHPLLGFASRSIICFLRAIPAIVWGIILVSAIGLGPFAGTIAIGLSGIGILGKAYADLIEEIDMGQVEAVKATGASWFQVIGQAVWPQFKAGFVGWSLYKLDLNIREAAVLGMIGAGGIGLVLNERINLFQYDQAAVGILVIFVLILAVEFTTAKIRERIL